jgi:STE24 endopeptidase
MEVAVDVGYDRDAHRSGGTLRRAALAFLLASAWVVAGTLLWRTVVPSLDLPSLDARAFFPDGAIERAEDFRRLTRTLWALETTVELGVLGLLAWKGRAVAQAVRGRVGGRIRTGLAVAMLCVLAVFAATLPFAAVDHWWQRRYGLSEQGYLGWLGELLVGLGVRAVLVGIGVAGAMALAARFGRRWWLPAGLALAGLGVLFTLLQPLAIEPLTNRFEPLRDARLAAEVRALARRERVRVGRVEVTDASRRTTAENAYVTGIGPTKHVVFYDTALDGRLTRPELAALAAHELAHVARRHVWKGAAWFALVAIPAAWILARVLEPRGGASEPALVPLGLLVAFALSLAALPFTNLVSRRYEAEADWLSLEATRDPGAVIGLQRELALSGLADPEPPAWATVWLATHPRALRRIEMACAWSARASPASPVRQCATAATRGGS